MAYDWREEFEKIPLKNPGPPPGELDPEVHDGVVELKVKARPEGRGTALGDTHGRVLARFVNRAKSFQSDIRLSSGGSWYDPKKRDRRRREEEDAKSIFGVMRIVTQLATGHPVYLRAHGPDADRAVRELGAFIQGGSTP